MKRVLMYSTASCPYCIRARQLLDQKGVPYRDIRVDEHPELRQEMVDKCGRYTVPQIWIEDLHIGGFDDMWALESGGKLDTTLAAVFNKSDQ